MLIQTFAIRLLTVLVYFLPFTFFMSSWVGKDTVLIYDKETAWKYKQSLINSDMENIDEIIKLKDTSVNVNEASRDYIEGLFQEDARNMFAYNQKWYEKLISPLPNYLSGFGILFFHKNTGIGITMWLSVILSLVTFLFWRFITRWMIAVLFVGINFIVVLIYMVSCLSNDVSLEYGFCLLFFLLIIQLWVEMRQLKYSIIGRLLSNLNK